MSAFPCSSFSGPEKSRSPVSESLPDTVSLTEKETVLSPVSAEQQIFSFRSSKAQREDVALEKEENAMSLEEREARWGFSLPELQTTAKVVPILFKNPSLFVADPYLSESRLYTMITRDRQTKKQNREVYKKIMNEEKSRRRQYQRFQDVEAVRKTTMKREREEALQSLLLPPPSLNAAVSLLQCDTTTLAEGGSEEDRYRMVTSEGYEQIKKGKIEAVSQQEKDSIAGKEMPLHGMTNVADSTSSLAETTSLSPDSSLWPELDRTLFRFVGAFENICRLEAIREASSTAPPATATTMSTTKTANWSALKCNEEAPRNSSPQPQPDRDGRQESTATETRGTTSIVSSASGSSSSFFSTSMSSPHKSMTEVGLAISQLTSQIYRYIPHACGTLMPPPLFSGPARQCAIPSTPDGDKHGRGITKSSAFPSSIFSFVKERIPLNQQCYLVSWELCMARAITEVVPLTPLRQPSDCLWATNVENTAVESPHGFSQCSLCALHPAFLAGEDVVVRGAPLPTHTLSSRTSTASRGRTIAGKAEEVEEDVVLLYRHWMAWLHQSGRDRVTRNDTNTEEEDNTETEPYTSTIHQEKGGSSSFAVAASVETMQRWCNSTADLISAPCSANLLLDELEKILVGKKESAADENENKKTLFQSLLREESALSLEDAALATLRLFLIRRLYGVAAVRHFLASPITIHTKPPTSDDVEPEIYNLYDDLQVYANETTSVEHLRVSKPASCYTCKVRYQVLHPYYYSMCHLCGEYNYNKRLMTADLRGKNVLLTGCRIKIGFMMALSLLRCGATLLGTTRFTYEALSRFRAEPDYSLWKDRLHLFSLDLRDMWMTTQFCYFIRTYFGGKLYAIINNAAQTIARTPAYTASLRALEQAPPLDLQDAFAQDRRATEWRRFFSSHTTLRIGAPLTLEIEHAKMEAGVTVTTSGKENAHRLTASPLQSSATPATNVWGITMDENRNHTSERMQPDATGTTSVKTDDPTAAIVSQEQVRGGSTSLHNENKSVDDGVVVVGQFDRYDTFAEESDAREQNSWVMNLAQVSGGEAAEVMAINALSPFILNAKLKPCLLNRDGEVSSPSRPPEPRFIINVSAMEGQFYRYKQTTHPHTNMAKAALNMMTRTSGEDYAADGIYMNAVDTGWITDESPKTKKERRAEQFLLCPLDEVDAAARCLDLIYTKSREYGKFYKDFKEIPW